MPLVYDASVVYDTPDYTYDGDLVSNTLTIQEALYRELKYAVLDGLVLPSRIKLDARPDADREYPWVIFRRVTTSEDNKVRYARERWEIVAIGDLTSPTAGDDHLQAIQDAVLDAFAGKHYTFGQFTEDGDADSSTGLKLKGTHVNTVELTSDDLTEKAHILIFLFSYVREI